MPKRIAKPCRVKSCRLTTTNRNGYCDDHQDQCGWAKYQGKQGSTTERGYGYEWEKVKKIVIRKQKGLCQPCLLKGKYTAFDDVDHIKPKAQGGTNDENNLQCICKECHKTKTAHESRGGEVKSLEGLLK